MCDVSNKWSMMVVLQDGVNSEIMALAQGHQDVAELLAKLKPVSHVNIIA